MRRATSPTTLHVQVDPEALAFWIAVAHDRSLIGQKKVEPASLIAP